MRIRSLILVILSGLSLSLADGVIIAGKSGIDAIDTLPINEWDIKTTHNSLPLTLVLGAIVPGGAQFYTEHYVRGSFLLALEGGLATEVFYNKPLQQQKRLDDSRVARDSAEYYTQLILGSGIFNSSWNAKRMDFLSRIRLNNDIKMKEEDLRRSELAWMLGLHLYGLMDGYGIWLHNRGRSVENRRVIDAVWRAALVPGLGQIYNDEYGKAGMLYMSFIGGAVSLHTRQGMVRYFESRHRTCAMEGAGSEELSQIDEDLLFFRKKRNQYIWGIALFYLYSIADAAVDAALSDFDSPLFWAFAPDPEGRGVSVSAGLHF